MFVHICQRHQQIFADLVARAGCTDPEEIAKVRCKAFAWFSAKYPMLVLEHSSNAACVGCTYEKTNFDKTEIYDAIRVIVSRIRIEASPPPRVGAPRALVRNAAETDVSAILPSIRVPTLVIHCKDDTLIPIECGRFIARQDHLFFVHEQIGDGIEEFLTGMVSVAESERVLATVLFTDIVGSTARAEQMGDRRWHDLLDAHHTTVRRELARYRGSEVKSLGDGLLATFDGPARAVRCACAIAKAVRALDIEIRCGLHTGEIELAERDVQGIAVHIAARISAAAAAGEILVSRTVKDLVAGSGLRFDARGKHSLKGFQDAMELYAASS